MSVPSLRLLSYISALCLLVACDQMPTLTSTENKEPVTSLAQDEKAIQTAITYRKSGRGREALAIMRDVQSRHPGHPMVLSELGNTLIAAGKPEEAVDTFDKLIAMEPRNALAHNSKAVAFDTAGNHVAAQEIYEKAIALAPNSSAIKNNLSLSMILNDEIDEAIRILEPLVAEHNNRITRHNLALAYGLKGNYERAEEISSRDITPEEAEENQRFYKYYAKLRHDQKAIELTKRVQSNFSEPVELIMDETPVVDTAADTAPGNLKPSASAPDMAEEITKQSLKDIETDAVKSENGAGTFLGYGATHEYPSR